MKRGKNVDAAADWYHRARGPYQTTVDRFYVFSRQNSDELGLTNSRSSTGGWLEFHQKMGRITIRRGYGWDGPSGPTFDTPSFMWPSLVHDAMYQLMREEIFPQSFRLRADRILRDLCLECGMGRFRASYVYRFVRLFGASSAARGSSPPG